MKWAIRIALGMNLATTFVTVATEQAKAQLGGPSADSAEHREVGERSRLRLWVDASGEHSVEARFRGLDEGKVSLEKPDGRVIRVSLEDLSEPDRQFVLDSLRGESRESGSGADQPGTVEPRPLDQSALVEQVEPSVVRIETDRGLGSGFVVRSDGLVATNFHVLEGASTATVAFRDKRRYTVAGFLAASPGSDLVVLKLLTSQSLPSLPLAVEPPRKLEQVIAFGAPRGLAFSVSQGHVSAIRNGEEIREVDLQTDGIDTYGMLGFHGETQWVQTTVPISSGNSGGPLVNLRGEVVGLNTWTKLRAQNLNFAVAASELRKLLSGCRGSVSPLTDLPRRSGHIAVTPEANLEYRIELPSGAVLSPSLFKTDVNGVLDWIEQSLRRDRDSMVVIRHANGSPFALSCHNHGTLDGVTLALYPTKDPMVYVTYADGERHGLLKTWNAKKEPVFWGQYVKGRRQGICCLFHAGAPWLVVECEHDKIEAIHLLHGAGLHKSYADRSAAKDDAEVQKAMLKLQEVEDELLDNERDFKKQIRECEEQMRRAKVAHLNPMKRKRMQHRINQHYAERDALIGALRRKAGL